MNDVEIKAQEKPFMDAIKKNYRHLLDASPGLIALVDANSHQIIYGNRQFFQRVGEGEQNHHRKVWDVVEPSNHALLSNQFSQVIAQRGARTKYVIHRLVDTQGNYDTFYVYATLAQIEEGITAFYLVMFPTFSDWHQPYVSFDSKELFLEQFSNQSFGTMEWVMGSEILFCSPGVFSVFGMAGRTSTISLQEAFDLVHPSDRDRIRALVKDCIRHRQHAHGEFHLVTAENVSKTVNMVIRLIQSEEGKLIKLVASMTDITEQKLIQRNLDHHVKELHRSNHELEEFAYVASHDLQEPLRKISTFCDRLQYKYADQLDEEGAMYLDRVMASAENMRVLIQDLLDFSRITRTSEQFHRVDLSEVVDQAKQDLEILIEETGTQISRASLPIVMGSPTQLIQLFANLFHNAIKFRHPDRKPQIRVECSPATLSDALRLGLDLEHEYYCFRVRDNGIGFEDEYANRIFQVFQRLHGKSEYPGSGIGLSICKKIVENHKGGLRAQGILGKGAEFIFLLPKA